MGSGPNAPASYAHRRRPLPDIREQRRILQGLLRSGWFADFALCQVDEEAAQPVLDALCEGEGGCVAMSKSHLAAEKIPAFQRGGRGGPNMRSTTRAPSAIALHTAA